VHQILAPDVELDRGTVKRLFKDYYKIMSLPPRRVKSMSQLSGRITVVLAVTCALLLLVVAGLARAADASFASADPPSCKLVRISDIGWTDVTSTTALFSTLVRQLGYDSQVTVLSVPVTYASMKNKDIDVFLGNWMPSMEGDRKAYFDDHSIDVIGASLTGAKYTLAVPSYTYQAGLHDFADLERFAPQLKDAIYGIEPGNDGNRLVLGMIKQNLFGLGGFKLIESSEQGMLAEVERAIHNHEPIVFLGWDPHPMNMRFDMRYLTGGDAVFGPNFGGATIYTNVRAGYADACPNLGRLLKNLKFTLAGESRMMDAILNQHQQPEVAATAWLKANPKAVSGWLEGVKTFDGRPALTALRAGGEVADAPTFEHWMSDHKIPIGDAVSVMIDFVKTHGRSFFDGTSAVIRGSVDGLTALLRAVPSPILIVAVAALAWFLRRSIPLVIFVTAALLFIINQGYWQATLETLSLVIVAAAVSAAIGIPLGIAAAHSPKLFSAMRPVLDLMQTLPTFVYLIPTLVLFGLGVVPGLISTVIFALPAPVRLTHLGISSVPKALIEAGEAFGATRAQMLWKVELPSAAPTIIAGITQCIMLSLSMVVIAALVGAGGLGVPVVRALNTVQVGMGFEAGFVIVLLAIILDRISRPAEKSIAP
jgi:glycine betaine/proline transport system substrate-binding protein